MDKVKVVFNNNWKAVMIALIGVSVGLIGQMASWWDLSVKRDDSYIQKYVDCQADCNKTVRELESEYAALKNRFNTLEIASSEIPFPYWIKDREGKILFVNNAYKTKVLIPLDIPSWQFINTKGEAIGMDFVDEIIKNDIRVIMEDRLIAFPEEVAGIGKGVSYKFPLRAKFSGIIGTGGIWIPDDPRLYK